jgi:hypothetical protein
MRKMSQKIPVIKFRKNDFLNAKHLGKKADNVLLESALHYASFGCSIIPLHSMIKRSGRFNCSCRDWKECDKQAKHPRTRYGLKDASTDEIQIRDWWTKFPTANVGLLTGKNSGFFVLDIDTKYGGECTLEYLQEFYRAELGKNYTPLPKTLTANTGSGGRHLFFKYPTDISIRGSVQEIGSGLDIRADGNYVVASPSNHKSKKNYTWFGINTPLLDAPDWLIIEIMSIDQKKSSTETTNASPSRLGGLKKIKDGEGRHEAFWRHICGLVNNRTQEEVLKIALQKNIEMLEPPKSESYVEYQVNYLYKEFGRSKNPNMGMKK